jgi:phage shock protein PspC (stress-responsive transcriptional regulator)
MDYQLFFGGLAFLFVGYVIYRFLLKNEKPASQETGGIGMTLSTYVGVWGSVLLAYLVGIIFILKSLP